MTKEKPRQYASGAVYERKDGRWVGALRVGETVAGKPRRITVYGKDEKDATAKLNAKKREIAKSGVPSARNATVKAWTTAWLELQKTRVRPDTWKGYRTAVQRWIIPAIGTVKLDKLRPAHVRQMTSLVRAATVGEGEKKRHLSSTTARLQQVILIKCMRDAATEGYPIATALLTMDAPGRAANPRTGIPLDGARSILTTAATYPAGSRWIAALLQGMRQGECLGLTWDAVDLDAGRIDVSWQLKALPFDHGCGGSCGYTRPGSCPQRIYRVPDGFEFRPLDGALCLTRPKTAAGHRPIPILPPMHAALSRWAPIAPKSPHRLVWPRADGRPMLAKDDLGAWKKLLAECGISPADRDHYVLHEARHVTSTLLVAAKVPESVRIAILGHARAVRSYEHVDLEMARSALEQVAEMLGLPA